MNRDIRDFFDFFPLGRLNVSKNKIDPMISEVFFVGDRPDGFRYRWHLLQYFYM